MYKKKPSWSRSIGSAALVIVVSACGAAGARTAEDVETSIDTAGSTVHIRNVGAPPQWQAVPVLRLGSLEGGPDEFGRIRSLLADDDGNVYVADNIAQEIRIFAPDGRYLRTIGRRGGGPGEFGDLYSLAWLGGNLVAMDPRNARISVLTREGAWVEGIQHFPITGPATLIRLHPLGSNAFYAPDPQRPQLSFVRFSTAGPLDTISYPRPAEGERPRGMFCRRADGGITSIMYPQAPSLVVAFPTRGGEVALSGSDVYRIAFLDPQGDTLRTVSREATPLPYPDELWEEAVRPYREMMENFPGSRCEPAAPERPPFRAALRHMLFDERGHLWVEAASEDGYVWEIFDAEGRLLGSAPAPAREPGIPPYAHNGHLYQVETDEMDVQYVAVYRVMP